MTVILIVEDESLIAADIEMMVEERGFSVLGPCRTVEAALAAVAEAPPDAALLDMNLGDGITSIPVARDLKTRAIPMAFVSGYTASTIDLPKDLADTPRLSKPIAEPALAQLLRDLTSG
ncbi:response regulator [Histidinibacterium aquaticum]|uniref:Response regulator n=1 Tax=Histidinibacterium aquaticum TaxID=2613962 RepID=A0A5J5GIE5_9RHOB|nr:response regulator [Histidinibacterium aquaticum]KAA9008029.1 response regulator [Histidinibacterium aquaticum]